MDVIEEPDAPIFESNQSLTLDPIWIGESTQQAIHVFDADGDPLTLTSNPLPNGLIIDGLQISGTITDDNLLNNQPFEDFLIDLTLSDGTEAAVTTKTFTLRVYSRNLPPEFVDENDNVMTSVQVTLNEDFNESVWKEAIGIIRFQDDNTQTGFSLSPISDPNHGQLTLDPTSSSYPILFTPDANFNGNDSFSVQLSDASFPPKSVILPFDVNVTAVNDFPNITSPIQATANENIPFSYQIQWEDVDGESGHAVTVSNLPSWLSYDAGNQTISGTASWSDYNPDPDEILITVTDSGNLSDSEAILISVRPINYPPTFDHPQVFSHTILEDAQLNLPLSFYDLDGGNDMTNVRVLSNPLNGLLDLQIQDNEINLNYIPEGNFTGSDFIEIQIYDPNDSNATDSISIPVTVQSVEDSPVIESIPQYIDAVVGYPWSYEFYGVDGDENQTVSLIEPNLPTWLTFALALDGNLSRGSVSGIPELSNVGTQQVILGVQDNSGLIGGQTFEVNVLEENSAPVILGSGSLNVELVEDSFWEKQNALSGQDENSQKLSWTLLSGPSHGTVSMSSSDELLNYFKYTPEENYHGADTVEIELSDGIDRDTFIFNFSIMSIEDLPEFTSQQNGNHFAFEDGEIVQEKITFLDGDGNLERYEIIGKPDWLLLDDTNFSSGELFLTGTPEVEDESNSTVEISIFDSQNNMSSISFVVEVYVLNYPPKLISLNQIDLIDEDSGSTKIRVFTVDDEDQASGHNWIIGEPSNGEIKFTENADGGFDLEYQPNDNFFGNDNFILRVEDSGTESGRAKA